MRKNLGPKSLVYVQPVLVVCTYDKDNVPNAMIVAWGGISDTNEVYLCLSAEHKTVKNLLKTKAFTVQTGTRKYVKEVDYLGMISGNDNKHKIEDCHLTTSKAKKVNAPIINELPFAAECELIKYDKKSGHLYGRIVNISADDSILTDKKIDIKKLDPIIYDGDMYNYFSVGKKVGKAYSDCEPPLN